MALKLILHLPNSPLTVMVLFFTREQVKVKMTSSGACGLDVPGNQSYESYSEPPSVQGTDLPNRCFSDSIKNIWDLEMSSQIETKS